MLAQIRRTIDRYRMLEGVRRLGVAVSGGADSVCLLDVLGTLAPEYGIELAVLHLDHGLRGPESRADAEFVRELAAARRLPFHGTSVDLPRQGNLEENGRRARLAFFTERIASGMVDRVATGHTRSDQAETVLFRILRGAAGEGLSGIRPVTRRGLIRPLLAIDRAGILHHLKERGLSWREDSTNLSRDFARNRIRHDLLPQLARDWNPGIASALAHLSDWALAEEDHHQDEVESLWPACYTQEGEAILVNAAKLASFPRSLARRIVRRAIEQVPGNSGKPGFDHVEAVLELAAKPEGGTLSLPGLTVQRSFDWVRFGIFASSSPWDVPLRVPGSVGIPPARPIALISLEIIDKSETSCSSHYVYNIQMGFLDRDLLGGPLTLRSWLPGDCYHPEGARSPLKLKELFNRARIPVWERKDWPVLTAGDRIAWSRRFGPATWCAARPETADLVRLQEVRL